MASNISVAITIDNKQYIAGINAANAATTAFAQKSQQSLGGVGTAFTGLGNQISGLTTKLAGLGFAAAAVSAIRFGDSIKDINDATGIAIQNVIGFSNVVAANGGNAESAQKAILKFVSAIDEAAGGSKEMQIAFANVNVSLKDLGNLSEQDLLANTIQGLAKITNASERVATAQKLLGKEFRAVNLQAVAQGYESASIAAAKYTDSINKTAELQNKLDSAFQKLQLAILKAIEPLADFVSKLTDEQIDKMVQGVIALGTAFSALAVVAPVIQGIGRALAFLGGAFALAKTGVAAITAGTALFAAALVSLNRTFVFAAGYIDRFSRGTGMFKAENGAIANLITLIGKLAARFPFLATGVAIVTAAFGGMLVGLGKIAVGFASVALAVVGINELIKFAFNVDPIDIMATKLEELVTTYLPGVAAVINKIGTALGMATAPSAGKPLFLSNSDNANEMQRLLNRSNANNPVANTVRPVDTTATDNAVKAIKEITAEYEKQRALTLNKLDLETRLIGKTQDEKQIAEAHNQLAQDYLNVQDQLIKKRDTLSKEDRQQGVLAAAINEQLKKNTLSYSGQVEALNKTVAANQHALMLEKNRQQELKNIFDLMEQIAQAQEDIANFQTQGDQARISAAEQVTSLKEGFDILMRREELERGIVNLREQDKIAVQQLFDLENDRKKQLEEIQKIQNLPFEGVGGMKQRIEEVNAAYDARLAKIKETQAKTTEEQDSFSFGWAQATEKYRNSITTNAEYAGKTMQNFTKGIEDVFVKFVQTGKLSFKDLANSMIADFARIQAQKALSGLFSMGGGAGGGILGSIGKLFGFANGGMPPVGQASIVGERGPELFVPQSAGKIIPNHALGGGGGQSQIINNAVTYSIQAVDASSFKTLLARDPEFLHNVSEQGRRSMPIRSRR
jgi:lambda family phage tail tape measure protein